MGQYGQLGKIVELFNGKKNGFFIECGALDGENPKLDINIFEPNIMVIALYFQVNH